MKMSDLTGGRGGRTPKTDGDTTPGSKRKTGGAADSLDTPTKRRGGAKAAAKKEEDIHDGRFTPINSTKAGQFLPRGHWIFRWYGANWFFCRG